MKRTFEERVVYAAKANQEGSPIKDFLSDEEIEQAIQMLADVLVVTGVRLTDGKD